jgi:alkanesulfonate monooxygenase SsuD/methylene tetrahydromethanopterin reductase-like flavin-dependent oxidoreductase (luciferase family)
MITKFSSLFAGHIDLGEMGEDTAPVDERVYSNEELASVFTKSEAIARCMDKLGFHTLWFAEHHFQREGYECIPNILMLAVHLAHLTENLRFGCGFNVSPMWHPLRLAEDFAMADVLTKGRVTFGVGRGYHTREVETFGAPMLDQDANRELFEEQLDVMFKAFHQDAFSHHGKHYTLPAQVPYRGYELQDMTLVPRPINTPVECWQPIVSSSPRGLDFMVKHGIKGIIGGGAALMTEGPVQAFQDAHARAGIETQLGENLCLGISFHLAPTKEQAIAEAKPYYEEHVKLFGPLGFLGKLSNEQFAAIGQRGGVTRAGMPTLEDLCASGAWYCGPPEGMIESLYGVSERYPGLDFVTAQSAIGTPETVIVEQLEQLAADVMPAFR